MRAALLLVPLLAGCTPREPCTRDFVFPDGQVRGAAGPSTEPLPLGVEGDPLTVKVFAPRTACDLDVAQLSARVELVGPDNFEAGDATLSEPQRGDFDVVRADLSFTPRQAGQYLMHVVFEPALGVRTTLLDVAERRINPPSVRVTVPRWSECFEAPWPVSADGVACERSTGVVEVYFSDGGVSSFAGEQLVVAGPVLWSVETASSELHRHLARDGGLVLTDTWSGFSNRTVRSMHDERSAPRALTSGQLVIARIEDSRVELGRQRSEVSDFEVFFVDEGRFFIETPCPPELTCLGLRGLEPEMLWSVASFGVGVVNGHARPLSNNRAVAEVVLRRTSEGLRLPERGFERLPLWLPLERSEVSVLVNADRPLLGFSAWERSQVIRVGKHFVLLKDPQLGDELRVTPR